MIILISVVVFVLVVRQNHMTQTHRVNVTHYRFIIPIQKKIHTIISIRSVNCNKSYCLNVKLAYFVITKPLA